jgi:hypothetical protein
MFILMLSISMIFVSAMSLSFPFLPFLGFDNTSIF